MSDRFIIRALANISVLEFALIFGSAVGIMATTLGAVPAIAAVAAATIAVASAGVGLTIVTMLLSSVSSGE